MSSQDGSKFVKSGNCKTENEFFSGEGLIDNTFNTNWILRFVEAVENNAKIWKDLGPTVEKYWKQSYGKQSQVGQKTLMQIRIYEQATEIMDETIENLDKKIELRNSKIKIIPVKIGSSDEKSIQEIERISLIEFLNETERETNLLLTQLH